MTTQLYIAGTEAVLPQDFSVTVKRENPLFTKSGEYTYDLTLRLDNPANQTLYAFLHRLNKNGQTATGRTALLLSDGRVVTRGTEIVTGWTDRTVTIQIVSAESELNWLVGQDKKVEELDLGTFAKPPGAAVWGGGYGWYDGATPVYRTGDYCLPCVRTPSGQYRNQWGHTTEYEPGQEPYTDPHDPDNDQQGGNRHTIDYCVGFAPQPYLCALVERILDALGYGDGQPADQLRQTPFANLFLVNTRQTMKPAEMFAGWTVREFLEEVERITGCVFLIDKSEHQGKKCDILLRSTYYLNTKFLALHDVIDAYEAEVTTGDDEGDAEFSASNVSYDMPSHRYAKLMKLPVELAGSATTEEYGSLGDIRTAAAAHDAADAVLFRDTSTGRTYIKASTAADGTTALMEVDQFADLKRTGATSTLELKITPAPMSLVGAGNYAAEIVDLGTADGYNQASQAEQTDSTEEQDFEDTIRNFTEEQHDTTDLYAAFFNGTLAYSSPQQPVAYTDQYHAMVQGKLRGSGLALSGTAPSGSLRLADIDAEVNNGAYSIDTQRTVTFQTFDPNYADPRQVYLIGGRLYVVRDIEETYGPDGRQPLWRMRCHPFSMSDAAAFEGWVLTRGTWDDGAVWLDDGRWIDTERAL